MILLLGRPSRHLIIRLAAVNRLVEADPLKITAAPVPNKRRSLDLVHSVALASTVRRWTETVQTRGHIRHKDNRRLAHRILMLLRVTMGFLVIVSRNLWKSNSPTH